MKQVVVNEQNEIIWHKERSEITSEDIYRVSALWVENSKGEVLLGLRSFLKHNSPGRWWSAVAGTIDEGESYEENIYKEAQEEIGLTGEKFELWELLRVKWEWNYFVQWYTLVLDRDISEFIKEEWQVEEIRWFTREELKNLIEKSPGIFTANLATYIASRVK